MAGLRLCAASGAAAAGKPPLEASSACSLVACTPESVNAHFTLGLAYEAQELFEEAEREYQAALGIFPKHSMSIDGVERVQRRQTQQP